MRLESGSGAGYYKTRMTKSAKFPMMPLKKSRVDPKGFLI